MNQESRHFFPQTPMGRPRLASRGFDSDDHIAEQLSTVIAVLTFEQGKRQDIGMRARHLAVADYSWDAIVDQIVNSTL